jgi:hypothetical protein
VLHRTHAIYRPANHPQHHHHPDSAVRLVAVVADARFSRHAHAPGCMRCLCCGVAWVRKGVTHTLTRDEGDATQALKRDIAELSACMQPMDVSALRQRGDERFKQKDFHGAVEAYSLLLQVSSPRPPRGEAADAGSARAPLPTSLAWAPFRRVSGGGRTQAPREASAPRRLALPFAWLGVSSCASAHLLTRRRGRTQMRGDGGPEVRKERLAAFANRAACHLCHSDFGLAVDDADRGLALLLGRVHLAAGEEEVRATCATAFSGSPWTTRIEGWRCCWAACTSQPGRRRYVPPVPQRLRARRGRRGSRAGAAAGPRAPRSRGGGGTWLGLLDSKRPRGSPPPSSTRVSSTAARPWKAAQCSRLIASFACSQPGL